MNWHDNGTACKDTCVRTVESGGECVKRHITLYLCSHVANGSPRCLKGVHKGSFYISLLSALSLGYPAGCCGDLSTCEGLPEGCAWRQLPADGRGNQSVGYAAAVHAYDAGHATW